MLVYVSHFNMQNKENNIVLVVLIYFFSSHIKYEKVNKHQPETWVNNLCNVSL